MNSRQFDVKWFFRRKWLNFANLETSRLSRCLGLVELTTVGIGATLGTGIYVVTPDSARQYAGPAMCVSFLIAALASVLSGLCYAELGARVPRAGSAYVYCYVAVGELWAFIVGWNMILEYVIGTASVARACSVYIDVLANGTLTTAFKNALPIGVTFLGEFADPIAFGITIFLTILLSVGVSESTFVNNMLVLVNCAILVYIAVVGFVYADLTNWQLTLEQVQNATGGGNSTAFGTGGFMPYGFGGVMTAASAAFYSFVGFDCISTMGEEVKNPHRNIPLAIVLSLAVCAVAYFAVSTVFTLDTPYYQLTPQTLLPNVPYGYLVVSIGAILCSCTCLLSSLFPLPRIIYSMAEDGLIFSSLGKISTRFKTPLVATLLSGVLTAIFSAIFDINQLVDMLSIGTLMAYSMVAASVLVLRYQESFIDTQPFEDEIDDDDVLGRSYGATDRLPILIAEKKQSFAKYLINLTNFRSFKRPNSFTSNLAIVLTCLICLAMIVMVTFAMWLVNHQSSEWISVLIVCLGAITVMCTIRLWLLPQNRRFSTYQLPYVPLLPVLGLFVNFYLLVSLNSDTWVRFGIWMAIGFAIFFLYGIWQSKEGQQQQETDVATEMSSPSGFAPKKQEQEEEVTVASSSLSG